MSLGWPLGNVNLLDKAVFQGASGEVQTLMLQRRINLIVASVTQGSLNVWFGSYENNLPLTPHLHFGQTNSPVWVPIPEMMTDLTIQVVGPQSPVKACLLVGGPSGG